MSVRQLTLLSESVEALAVECDSVITNNQSAEELVESLASFDNNILMEYTSLDDVVFPDYTQQSGWKFLAIAGGVAAIALAGFLIYKHLKDKNVQDKAVKAIDKLADELGKIDGADLKLETKPDVSDIADTPKVSGWSELDASVEELKAADAKSKEGKDEISDAAAKNKEAVNDLKQNEAARQKTKLDKSEVKEILTKREDEYQKRLSEEAERTAAERKAAEDEINKIMRDNGVKEVSTEWLLTNLHRGVETYGIMSDIIIGLVNATGGLVKDVLAELPDGDFSELVKRGHRATKSVPTPYKDLVFPVQGAAENDPDEDYVNYGASYVVSEALMFNGFFDRLGDGLVVSRVTTENAVANSKKAKAAQSNLIKPADLSRIIELIPKTFLFWERVHAKEFDVYDASKVEATVGKIDAAMEKLGEVVAKVETVKPTNGTARRVRSVALNIAKATVDWVNDFSVTRDRLTTLIVKVHAARAKAIAQYYREMTVKPDELGSDKPIGYTQQNLVDSMAAVGGKLGALFAKTKTALTSFLELGSDDIITLHPRDYSSLSKGNYVALTERRVIIPKGLKVSYSEYLSVLHGITAYITPLYNGVLLPSEKFLASLLNDPTELSSNRPNAKLRDIKTYDIAPAKKMWAGCFDTTGRERAPFGELIKNLNEWPKIVGSFNEINDVKLSSFTKEQVSSKVNDIVELISMLGERMEEQPDVYKASGVTAKSLSEFTHRVALHVEFYAMFLFAMEQLRASIEYARNVQLGK